MFCPDLLAEKIRERRALYAISGTRSQLVPPPGWRAPRDWARYPIPLAELQETAAPGRPPKSTGISMEWLHEERGRLIYGCEREWWLMGARRERE